MAPSDSTKLQKQSADAFSLSKPDPDKGCCCYFALGNDVNGFFVHFYSTSDKSDAQKLFYRQLS